MKKVLMSLICFLALHSAMGWGQTGHRVTGWIAEQYLNKKARKELERILMGQSLAMASTWMDEVRSDSTFRYMDDWHWVTIQDGHSYNESEKNPKGDVVEAIDRIIKKLKSHSLSAIEEAQYVRMLIHLVGDVHQPLHVGGGSDRGGNDVKVSWFKTDTNLHRVWDSDMIDDTRLSYTELAQSLGKLDALQVATLQKAKVEDWVKESMDYRKDVYEIGNGKLSYSYPYKNFHIVRKRLLEAGVRLAGVLNQIYG